MMKLPCEVKTRSCLPTVTGWLLVLSLLALSVVGVQKTTRVKLFWETSPLKMQNIRQVEALALRYQPTKEQLADEDGWRQVAVRENGETLVLQAVSSEEVAAQGRGRYAVTPKNLWFSSTDGTDPRSNGRVYDLWLPWIVPAALWHTLRIGFIVLLVLHGVLLWRLRREHLAGVKLTALQEWRQHRWFWLGCVGVVAVRFLLTAWDEIVAAPSDPESYVFFARQGFYGMSPNAHVRLPVYPVFLSVCQATGLPLRFWMEVVQWGAFAIFAAGCRMCGASRGAVLAVFAALMLCPLMADWSNYCFPDILYAPLSFAVVGLLLWLVARPRWWLGIVCGIGIGLLLNLREERVLIYGMWFLALVAALGLSPRRARAVVGMMLAFLVMFAVDAGFKASFKARTGIEGNSLLATPGMKSLMETLFSLPQEGPPQRYFLVDAEMRKYAASLSPTFREANTVFEKSHFLGNINTADGRRDLSPDAIVWESLNAFAVDGSKALLGREQRMLKVREEIENSLLTLSVPRQTIYMGGTFPINDAVVTLLKEQAASLAANSLRMAFLVPPMETFPAVYARGDKTIPMYDEVANRRTELAAKLDAAEVSRPGWVRAGWRVVHWLRLAAMPVLAVMVAAMAVWWVLSGEWKRVTRRGMLLWVPVAVLAYFASTRLMMCTILAVYFGDAPRYLLPLALAVLPMAVLAVDGLRKRRGGVATRSGV